MKKKLTKSADNIVLTGTLGGIAEFLGIDPTIIRVIYVFLSFIFFAMPVMLYIVLALVIPSSKGKKRQYGHHNRYYQNNQKTTHQGKSYQSNRKEAEKITDDDWSDF
ncbi:MAG: PspC domain-containing protein [Enterococcus sp.]